MASLILVEEFHLPVHAPRDLPKAEDRALRRTLTGARFRAALGRAIRAVFRRYAALRKVRVTLTR